MQLEWLRYTEGLTAFKAEQGLLWLACLLVIILQKKVFCKNSWMITGIFLGGCILCPFTAVGLMKIFTPFYTWKDLQMLFPMELMLAFLFAEAVMMLGDRRIPGLRAGKKTVHVLAVLCLTAVLFAATGFRGLVSYEKADAHGVPLKYAEAYEALQQHTDGTLLIAAPADMLQYLRLYETDWKPLFGRDLWSSKSASYINSGYDIEYKYYTFLEEAQLVGEEAEAFKALLLEHPVDCVIVPSYWEGDLGELSGYEYRILTDTYVGIIKKDLWAK